MHFHAPCTLACAECGIMGRLCTAGVACCWLSQRPSSSNPLECCGLAYCIWYILNWTWAARYTWLLIELTPEAAAFSFLVYSIKHELLTQTVQATTRFKATAIPAKKSYYRTDESPDVWFEPTEVWEIRGADLTISPVHKAAVGHIHPDRGISLRHLLFDYPPHRQVQIPSLPLGALQNEC